MFLMIESPIMTVVGEDPSWLWLRILELFRELLFGGFSLLDFLWRFFVVVEDRDLDDPLFCFVSAFVSDHFVFDTLGSTDGDSLKASLLSGRKLYSSLLSNDTTICRESRSSFVLSRFLFMS